MFLAPLQVAALIPKHAESVIFSNIEAIQAVNRELLSHMETKSLGDTFLALAPFLKLYSTYANNFEQACSVLQVCLLTTRISVWLGYIHAYPKVFKPLSYGICRVCSALNNVKNFKAVLYDFMLH